MIYIKSFLLVGFISMIGQIILDNTKLTPGHITSIFVISGAVLSFFGIYDIITEFSLVGSKLPITSFGNALYQAALEGFNQNGFIGMFNNILSTTSCGISAAIFFGFIFSLLFKIRD
ncbi:MAG TPA: SpoVA/SpoVAEb family sporulation membrane protein [Candidatus Coprovivens excrementavium]|nr:SpoVA/SpoVAEb family sporulation membrane protein [Candidatus Coprovivens excrementavium]